MDATAYSVVVFLSRFVAHVKTYGKSVTTRNARTARRYSAICVIRRVFRDVRWWCMMHALTWNTFTHMKVDCSTRMRVDRRVWMVIDAHFSSPGKCPHRENFSEIHQGLRAIDCGKLIPRKLIVEDNFQSRKFIADCYQLIHWSRSPLHACMYKRWALNVEADWGIFYFLQKCTVLFSVFFSLVLDQCGPLNMYNFLEK